MNSTLRACIHAMISILLGIVVISCKESSVNDVSDVNARLSVVRDVREATNGDLIVGGWTVGASPAYSYAVARFDADGNARSMQAYGNGLRYELEGIDLCRDGGVAVSGASRSTSGSDDFFMAKIAADGSLQWETTLGNDSWRGMAVEETDDGELVAAGGWANDTTGGLTAYVVKTAANGDTLWTARFGFTSLANDLKILPDRRIAVAGFLYGDAYLYVLDSAGHLTQGNGHGGDNYEEARALALTNDGGYVLAGYSESYGDRVQAYVARVSSSMGTVWTKTFGDTAVSAANAIAVTANGGFIVAGYVGQQPRKAWIIRLSSDGDSLWSVKYERGAILSANSIQQTQDGGFIAAGNGFLLKLSADGDTLWSRIL
ncbi:hypothetical protein HZB60_09330 [candidate division KSB1 bacterium]|nr:hypothetical protein [candidate division KSB1 bacterium]